MPSSRTHTLHPTVAYSRHDFGSKLPVSKSHRHLRGEHICSHALHTLKTKNIIPEISWAESVASTTTRSCSFRFPHFFSITTQPPTPLLNSTQMAHMITEGCSCHRPHGFQPNCDSSCMTTKKQHRLYWENMQERKSFPVLNWTIISNDHIVHMGLHVRKLFIYNETSFFFYQWSCSLPGICTTIMLQPYNG